MSTISNICSAIAGEELQAAEAQLLSDAETFGPDDLRILGRRIFDVIDPEAADAVEGRLLDEEEARARCRARLWMRPAGDGSTHGGFQLPDAQADMLKTALDALITPRRSPTHRVRSVQPVMEERSLPYVRRLGLAFCELVEHLPVDRLPQSARSSATVTVDIDYDALVSGLGAASLSTGTRISAGEARRLACNSGLLPAVLAGSSVVLDLGREERLYTRHQRIAMGKAQGGCIADGCERPPAWCEAHHPHAWADGGRTDVSGELGGVLLCGRHHHLVHRQGWDASITEDGIPELVPPRHIDPDRRPIRHRRFRRRSTASERLYAARRA